VLVVVHFGFVGVSVRRCVRDCAAPRNATTPRTPRRSASEARDARMIARRTRSSRRTLRTRSERLGSLSGRRGVGVTRRRHATRHATRVVDARRLREQRDDVARRAARVDVESATRAARVRVESGTRAARRVSDASSVRVERRHARRVSNASVQASRASTEPKRLCVFASSLHLLCVFALNARASRNDIVAQATTR